MTIQLSEEPKTATLSAASGRNGRPAPPSRWGDFPPPPPVRPAAGTRDERVEGGILGRIAAATLLVLLAPLFALVALVVKLDSPAGPVFFRQERVGLDRRRPERRRERAEYRGQERREGRGFGKPFYMWKFRTMIPDAEAKTGPVWAAERDPRITRVGRVLRTLRLDELPQLLNVVRGEMSLIGPRPERPHFVEQLTLEMPRYDHRLRVPPGITGLAQVERDYDSDLDSVRTKLKYDLFYVENRSTLMDFKILLKTVDVMLRGRGAR